MNSVPLYSCITVLVLSIVPHGVPSFGPLLVLRRLSCSAYLPSWFVTSSSSATSTFSYFLFRPAQITVIISFTTSVLRAQLCHSSVTSYAVVKSYYWSFNNNPAIIFFLNVSCILGSFAHFFDTREDVGEHETAPIPLKCCGHKAGKGQ